MRHKHTSDADSGSYLNIKWAAHVTAKYMEASVNARMYKGRILLSTEPTDTSTVKAMKVLGIPTSAPAWLNVAEIDGLLKMLREARRVVQMHKKDVRKVAHCRECQKYFASVCPRHKALFKKYGKTERS